MHEGLELIERGLAMLAAADQHAGADVQLLAEVETLLVARDRIDGLLVRRLQVLHTRDATAAEYGRQTRSWLIEDRRLAAEEASKLMSVARALPARPYVDEALTAGDITLEHARNIVTAAAGTPEEIRDVVEKELIVAAGSVDPTTLGAFAREVRSRLGGTESAEAAEARLHGGRYLNVTRTFDGMHRIDGMLDPAGAAIVQSALAPFNRKSGIEDRRSRGQRRADGLVAIAELALRAGELPDTGGEKPHVTLTLGYDRLAAKLDEAVAAGLVTLDGYDVSPATARMIACDAGIIPAVLGGASEVLDLGRRSATWSTPQRRALHLQAGGTCQWPGCQTRSQFCQIHHMKHWAHGGHTDLTNGVLLCWFHHWLIHHSNWKIDKDRRNTITVWRE